MGILSAASTIYDLDTLDTRFTTSSSVPYQTVIDARNDPAAARDAVWKAKAKSQPSKWRTPEFVLYYGVVAFAIISILWVGYDVSKPEDPRYYKYQRWLRDGWVPGRKRDISDMQYRTFRVNLPYMAILLVAHPLLRRVWERVYNPSQRIREASRLRLQQRTLFDLIFGHLFLFILHGFSSFKVILILYLNYQIATKLPRKYIPAATWVFNIAMLFATEIYKGFSYRAMASVISPPREFVEAGENRLLDSGLIVWGAWLDKTAGIIPRWQILFNFTILRLISFNMDRYWSAEKKNADVIELANVPKKKQLDPANLSDRDRVTIPAPAQDFTWRNYIAYTIYAPLYLAGPILTFNDYMVQCRYRAASIEWPRTIRYAIRFALVLLAMELLLHYNYVGAISNSDPVWSDYTAAQLCLLSFINLHIIWLKLLLPWRLFRLWALVDGIDPPENMIRCVSDNFSTQYFWRAWHRSFNRWIVRYMYVPLGGASFRSWKKAVQSTLTFLVVFSFVALWHDLQLRLLIWGWLIVFFMVPEWTAAYLFPKSKWEDRPTQYRMLCCLGAIGNVLMMIAANTVGFSVGLDGLQSIISSVLHTWSGFLFLIASCVCLFTGIQVMFELRESEKRRGIDVKC